MLKSGKDVWVQDEKEGERKVLELEGRKDIIVMLAERLTQPRNCFTWLD